MLVRDPTLANAKGITQMLRELKRKDRQVAVFLLDHHPTLTPYITTDLVLGVGWDDVMPADLAALRWLGERFSPSGCNSTLVDTDLEVATVITAAKLARDAARLEIQTATPVWIFAQAHIRSVADCEKLARYMGKYRVKTLTN